MGAFFWSFQGQYLTNLRGACLDVTQYFLDVTHHSLQRGLGIGCLDVHPRYNCYPYLIYPLVNVYIAKITIWKCSVFINDFYRCQLFNSYVTVITRPGTSKWAVKNW